MTDTKKSLLARRRPSYHIVLDDDAMRLWSGDRPPKLLTNHSFDPDEERHIAFGRTGSPPDDGSIFINLGTSERVDPDHARLRVTDAEVVVVDRGSKHGTFVNGQRLTPGAPCALREDYVLRIADVDFTLSGETLRQVAVGPAVSLVASNVMSLAERARPASRRLLHGVDVAIPPGTLAFVKGLTGSGKSVLLEALSGRRKPDGGSVRLNGKPLADYGDALGNLMGFVPSERACIPSLTVERWLRLSALLRCPESGRVQIRARVQDVLDKLLLKGEGHKKLSDLSEGQRRRVLLGSELLADPPVLFVDEVTSNVDVGTEEHILRVLRRKADRQHVIVVITHHDLNMEATDRIVFMARGHVVYDGSPADLLEFFDAPEHRRVNQVLRSFDTEPEQDEAAAELHARFQEELGPPVSAAPASANLPALDTTVARRCAGPGRQFGALLLRNFHAFVQDRGAMALTLLLGPLIAFLANSVLNTHVDQRELEKKVVEHAPEVARAVRSAGVDVVEVPGITRDKLAALGKSDSFWQERNAFAFRRILQCVLVIVVVGAGLLLSSLTFVRERHLYVHERIVGVRRGAWLGAKMAWLAIVGAALSLGVAWTATQISELGDHPWQAALVLYGVAMSSIALGLAISAWAPSEVAALFVALLAIVGHLLYSGLIPHLGATGLSPSHWGAAGLASTLDVTTWQVYKIADMEPVAVSPWSAFARLGAFSLVFLGVAWAGLRRIDDRGFTR